MKVERKNKGFQPVVITLESQEEVDIVYELLNSVGGLGKIRQFTDELSNELSQFTDHGINENVFFTGSVQCIE